MSTHGFDVQGRVCGIPYDFRRPTWREIASRLYAPGAPMLVPKVWGCGWTLNLANRASQVLIALCVIGALASAIFS